MSQVKGTGCGIWEVIDCEVCCFVGFVLFFEGGARYDISFASFFKVMASMRRMYWEFTTVKAEHHTVFKVIPATQVKENEETWDSK